MPGVVRCDVETEQHYVAHSVTDRIAGATQSRGRCTSPAAGKTASEETQSKGGLPAATDRGDDFQ